MARLSDIPNDSLLFFSFSKKFVFTVCPCVPNDILTNWRMKLDTNLPTVIIIMVVVQNSVVATLSELNAALKLCVKKVTLKYANFVEALLYIA